MNRPLSLTAAVLVVGACGVSAFSAAPSGTVSSLGDPFNSEFDHRKLEVDRGHGAKVQQLSQRQHDDLLERMMSQPSPCVWAILACCAPTNFHFRFGCFPYLGCSALFWQTDPCQLQTVLHSVAEASKFYAQFDKRPPPSTPPPTIAPPTIAPLPTVAPAADESVPPAGAAAAATTTSDTTTPSTVATQSTTPPPPTTTTTTTPAATTKTPTAAV